MLGLAAVPSIVMFFGCLVLPESPRWLVSKGYSERAKKVLVKLRGTMDVSSELGAMKNVCDEEESFQKNSKCVGSPILGTLRYTAARWYYGYHDQKGLGESMSQQSAKFSVIIKQNSIQRSSV